MRPIVVLALACALTACGGGDPQSSANAVTRAVYNDNPAAVTAHLDDALRSQVSRASVGLISDKMHALGSYNGLTLLGADTASHEYTYRANFSKGTLNVVIRLDTDGLLSAYRVFPT